MAGLQGCAVPQLCAGTSWLSTPSGQGHCFPPLPAQRPFSGCTHLQLAGLCRHQVHKAPVAAAADHQAGGITGAARQAQSARHLLAKDATGNCTSRSSSGTAASCFHQQPCRGPDSRPPLHALTGGGCPRAAGRCGWLPAPCPAHPAARRRSPAAKARRVKQRG